MTDSDEEGRRVADNLDKELLDEQKKDVDKCLLLVVKEK